MTRRLVLATTALALAAPLSLALAAPASAAPNARGACVQAGLGTLKSLDLLQAAAQKQVDYSALADASDGPIFMTLETPTYLSLGTVVKLHTTNPELFAWCAK
jgi:hypothetical protein